MYVWGNFGGFVYRYASHVRLKYRILFSGRGQKIRIFMNIVFVFYATYVCEILINSLVRCSCGGNLRVYGLMVFGRLLLKLFRVHLT